MTVKTIFDNMKQYFILVFFVLSFFACRAGEYKRDLSDNTIGGFISEFIELDADRVVISKIDRSIILSNVTIKRIKPLEKNIDADILTDSIILFPILKNGDKLSGGFHVFSDDIYNFVAFLTNGDKVNNTINVRFSSNEYKPGKLKKVHSLAIDLSRGSDASAYLKNNSIQMN
jgi:hypothetical protein